MAKLSIVSLQNKCLEAKPGLPREVHNLLANTSATAPVRIHFQIQSFPRQVFAALIGNPNGRLQANNCDRLGHWGMWNDDIGLTLKASATQASLTCRLTDFRNINDKGEGICWLELICWCSRVGCHVGLKGLWCIASFRYFSDCHKVKL